ncbi:MAG: UDP-N-acetylmuramoyl-tripeptide--D-alanyl-D-alanine ligase [Firmicutes bacterium]|nr:UDP-N-acetylmuramoyl-tripeptide--D-alanyl-D-alanine ligase [Bacillota bacterium]
MTVLSAREVIEATGGTLAAGAVAAQFSGISTDSRGEVAGRLFIALQGPHFDGHDFVSAAFAGGAAGAVVSKDVGVGDVGAAGGQVRAVIKVRDTLQALWDIARHIRARFAIPIVAVTGSTGKTTTKDMIYCLLRRRFKTLKTEANYNNEIGLPLTLARLDGTFEAGVVELGMRALGEIRALVSIARPDIGVVTNVGVAHMELLGSRENIARAKAELVEALPLHGAAVLNADDPFVIGMRDKTRARVITYGVDRDADLQASDIRSLGVDGVSARFHYRGRHHEVVIPIPGRHNVYNALAAAGAAIALDFDLSTIADGLRDFVPAPMRMQISRTDQDVLVINDAYNANPVSVKSALETLRELGGGRRKIAVLGDMLELGDLRDEAHMEVGRCVVGFDVDILMTVGDSARLIAIEAGRAGMQASRIRHFDEALDALPALLAGVRPGDAVLVKGSRAMGMERLAEALVSGSESESGPGLESGLESGPGPGSGPAAWPGARRSD